MSRQHPARWPSPYAPDTPAPAGRRITGEQPGPTFRTGGKRSAQNPAKAGPASVSDWSQVAAVPAMGRLPWPEDRNRLRYSHSGSDASNGQDPARGESNRYTVTSAVIAAVLYCCTRCPGVRIMVLTCGATETRTPDLLHAIHTPAVAGRGCMWPCVEFTCGFRGCTWPGVAWCRCTLAPHLAPRTR